jgi:hypothetical protein
MALIPSHGRDEWQGAPFTVNVDAAAVSERDLGPVPPSCHVGAHAGALDHA